ncbi:PEGA domain-containing protein [Patescibacteria group bacterium]|nr:PEGA domain-containing protein [Patescibacteria group bacterium]MBU0860256.1 PEGA domain-containing protein [Alphaproteobacteria bacterium]MBU1754712.1 PEGA domain-containing protein [Patescibacteria group bacterium]
MQTIEVLADFGKRFWPWILVFTFSALVVWVYLSGWRVGLDPLVYRNGSVAVSNLPLGSTIYVDQTRRHTGVSGTADTHLPDGEHTVIIDSPGFYPWNEMVSVKKNERTVLKPILVRVTPDMREVPLDKSMQLRQIGSPIPTFDKPMNLPDNCISVYESFGRIIAAPMEGCEAPAFLCTSGVCEPTVVFTPKDRLRAITNFHGRSDVIVVASGTTVTVVELDPHTPQFLAPLYQGDAPRVINLSPNSLTVIDRSKTFLITL